MEAAETTAPPLSATEADSLPEPGSVQEYEAQKAQVIQHLIAWLQLGDRLGKSQAEMAGEFMAAFGQAAATLEAAIEATKEEVL